ncbi:MAG: Transketolase subunit A [Parcubacteria group bacterium GW2011_GWA2_51_10]|nr:MAG: Transketolase subunit A [Parcubacteria group bacterium GW2011_GWA2_51_10]
MHKSKPDIEQLKKTALAARKMLIRIASKSHSPHIGSSLSHIDITTALYSAILNVTPKTARDPCRDRFILSKGHAALGYYCVLALHGFISQKELERYGKNDTKLAGHPVLGTAKGIEATSGALGHGLAMALGLALAGKRDGLSAKYVVLVSDGECDEGSTWEAILLAGHLGLDNLTVIVDYNKIQSFGRVEEVLDLEPFADKWEASRWAVASLDGHDFAELLPALSSLPLRKGKPTVIIAHTIKGKGVPIMENKLEWHYRDVRPEDLEETLAQVY